jgi:hypothetical protein
VLSIGFMMKIWEAPESAVTSKSRTSAKSVFMAGLPWMPRVASNDLSAQSADDSKNVTAAFLQSLAESGYVEGRNVVIESRWAENQYDRLPGLAADLVRRRFGA